MCGDHMTEKSTDDIRKQYERNTNIYRQVRDAAVTAIRKALSETDIKVHDVLSRVKDTDSFLKKVESRDFGDPFEDLDDIIGLRVLVLFLPDIDRVGEVIKACFKLVKEDDKTKKNIASDFGYLGTHYTVTLDTEWTGRQNAGLCEQKIEIQLRTLAMDAWATISHYLDYKQEIDIPRALRRDFYALNGLFYVADTHFEMIYKDRQRVAEELEDSLGLETADASAQPINLDSLMVFLSQTYPTRRRSRPSAVSDLVYRLRSVGITKIEQLSALVDKAAGALENYEREVITDKGWFRNPTGANAVNNSLQLSSMKYRELYGSRRLLAPITEKHRIDK